MKQNIILVLLNLVILGAIVQSACQMPSPFPKPPDPKHVRVWWLHPNMPVK